MADGLSLELAQRGTLNSGAMRVGSYGDDTASLE